MFVAWGRTGIITDGIRVDKVDASNKHQKAHLGSPEVYFGEVQKVEEAGESLLLLRMLYEM